MKIGESAKIYNIFFKESHYCNILETNNLRLQREFPIQLCAVIV